MRRLLSLAALPCLAACTASDQGYPSLLPRAIETRSDAEPVRPDVVAKPDAALDSQIAEQRTRATSAAQRFTAAANEAEVRVAVARAVAVGSEAWVRAQTALAQLSPIRGETTQIVTALEQVAIARASAGEPAYPALDAAIAEISAISQAQSDRLTALEGALAG